MHNNADFCCVRVYDAIMHNYESFFFEKNPWNDSTVFFGIGRT